MGGSEHSLVKVATLKCKTAGNRPCLLWWGGWESVIFGPKLFSEPSNCHDVDHKALVLSDGQLTLLSMGNICNGGFKL